MKTKEELNAMPAELNDKDIEQVSGGAFDINTPEEGENWIITPEENNNGISHLRYPTLK